MKADGVFFVGVILFFFILWFATGGPTKPISFAGPYITPITDVDTTQEGYGDTPSASFGSNDSGGSFWSSIMGIENRIASLQRDNSEIRTFGEASVYEGQVTISGGGTSATEEDQEYITLRASGSAPINITGWRLVSGATGKDSGIPRGASLPRSGRVNTTSDIVLNPGDEAIIVTGEGPTGVSFKENMCTGYFGQNQTFYPSLQNQCPAPYDEFDRFFEGNELKDDKCYNLVRSTNSCTRPKTSGVSNACENFVEDYLTYSGCVKHHQNDSQFRGETWRIYLEEDKELWKSNREAIKLIDQNGKTVDLYSY